MFAGCTAQAGFGSPALTNRYRIARGRVVRNIAPNRFVDQGGFSGLGSFGDAGACGGPANPTGTRPSPDYVMTGDVVQVRLALLAAGNDPLFGTSQADGISALHSYNWPGSCLALVALDDSAAGILTLSPVVVIQLQATQDFSHINDVVSIVMSVASSVGLQVDTTNTSGAITSAVQVNLGIAPTTTKAPNTPTTPGTCPTGNLLCMLGLTNPTTGLLPTWLAPVGIGLAALLVFSIVKK